MRIPRQQAIPRRRAFARAAALSAVGACAWAGAPAIATATPRAADFAGRLPAMAPVAAAARAAGHDHAGEGPVTHRSPVIEAPDRFDAVGLAGELRPTEMRARDTGGEWSEWVEAAQGDPAWFGGADELQVRTRGWRPAGKLVYVRITEDRTQTSLARDPAKPAVVSRVEWGADQGPRRGCRPRTGPEYGQVRAVVVHHTVSAVNYTEAEAPGMILAICRFHRDGNGWNDIGYNALVDRFGNVYAGRDGGLGKAVVGAHAQGFNAQTSGVAALGTHSAIEVSDLALRGLARFIAWKLAVHDHDADDKAKMTSAGGAASRYPAGQTITTNRIIGHRRVGLTECPGTALNRQIDKLIVRVQRRIDGGDGSGGGSSGGVGRS